VGVNDPDLVGRLNAPSHGVEKIPNGSCKLFLLPMFSVETSTTLFSAARPPIQLRVGQPLPHASCSPPRSSGFARDFDN